MYYLIFFNLKGLEQGRLSINLCPCSSSGKVLNEEQFVDQPEELLAKPYSFKVIISLQKQTNKINILDNNAFH